MLFPLPLRVVEVARSVLPLLLAPFSFLVLDERVRHALSAELLPSLLPLDFRVAS